MGSGVLRRGAGSSRDRAGNREGPGKVSAPLRRGRLLYNLSLWRVDSHWSTSTYVKTARQIAGDELILDVGSKAMEEGLMLGLLVPATGHQGAEI